MTSVPLVSFLVQVHYPLQLSFSTEWLTFRVTGEFPEDYKIPNLSLRNSEENLIGRDRDMFLDFISKMLKWVPEDRATAAELLQDPWLNGEPFDALDPSFYAAEQRNC
jgi:serine/threonine protein kinase